MCEPIASCSVHDAATSIFPSTFMQILCHFQAYAFDTEWLAGLYMHVVVHCSALPNCSTVVLAMSSFHVHVLCNPLNMTISVSV